MIRLLVPTLILLGSLACHSTSSLDAYNKGDDDDDDDTDAPMALVGIDRLDPDWGPPDGGTPVTIHGWGFEGSVDVYFGSAPLNVTKVDDGTVIVTAPEVGVETAVDVQIISDLGQATLTEGFAYSYEEPIDTEDTDDTDDSDPNVNPTGMTGGVIQFSRLQIACQECVGAVGEFEVSASAAIHDPINGSWIDWMPPIGSCATNPTNPGMATTYKDIGQWVFLDNGGVQVALPRGSGSNGPLYEVTGLGVDDYDSATLYDLEVPDGGSGIPSFTQNNAMFAADGFTSIQPQELLYVNILAAFQAEVSQSAGMSYSWGPTGGGFFVILHDIYSPDGSTYLGNVLCRGDDNGFMHVSGANFGGFPLWALMTVSMYRYHVTESVLPHNGSTLEAVSQTGVMGTAYLGF